MSLFFPFVFQLYLTRCRAERRDIIAILSSTNRSALTDWLAAHQFKFPKEKQSVLDQYIQKHWFFVAARINPEGNSFVVKTEVAKPAAISPATRKKLATGELHPIIISFPSEKCVFPLAISSVNGGASEISLYVLSADPLANPVIFDRKLKVYLSQRETKQRVLADTVKLAAEMRAKASLDSPLAARRKADDPNDPPPPGAFERSSLGAPEPEFYRDPEEDFYSGSVQPVRSMPVNGESSALSGCRHDLPGLKGKKWWWLTKLVETFPPEEMVDLEFEPAISFLAERMRREDGEAAAHCLPQYGELAVLPVLQGLTDSDAAVRRRVLPAAMGMSDSRFVDPLISLMEEKDPKTRVRACYATGDNWNQKFIKPLLRLCHDPEPGIALLARYALQEHLSEINLDNTALRSLLSEDSPASLIALQILRTRNEISEKESISLFSSTNLSIVSSTFAPLRDKLQLKDLTPLMTNSLPMARMMALGVLIRMADKPAVERIVSMLHDPNETIRWRVRSALRRLTGQKLGADPAAYEKWWAENKETFVPVVTTSRSH